MWPSWKLTYPSLEKGKSSSNPWRVHRYYHITWVLFAKRFAAKKRPDDTWLLAIPAVLQGSKSNLSPNWKFKCLESSISRRKHTWIFLLCVKCCAFVPSKNTYPHFLQFFAYLEDPGVDPSISWNKLRTNRTPILRFFFGPLTSICSSGFECFANDEGQPHVGLLEIIRHLGTIPFVNRKGWFFGGFGGEKTRIGRFMIRKKIIHSSGDYC